MVGCEQPEHGVSQGCEGLGRIFGANAAGVFGERGVPDPVEGVLDAPVPTAEFEELMAGRALARQAGDCVDDFLGLPAGQLARAADTAELGHTGPVEVGGKFAGGGQFPLLDAAVSLFDASRGREIRRRAAPGDP